MPFVNFLDIDRLAGLAMPCKCSSPNRLTGFLSLFYFLVLIHSFKYETVVISKSSASSFGHSDPDLSSVALIRWEIQLKYNLLLMVNIHPKETLDIFSGCNIGNWYYNPRNNGFDKKYSIQK